MFIVEWTILVFCLGVSIGAYVECQSTLKKLKGENDENPH